MKRSFIAALSVLFFVSTGCGFEKDKLEDHLRKNFNIDSRTPIEIGDPKDIDFAKGMKEVKIKIGNQEMEAYISKNGKEYLWGKIFDLTVDPDEERASQISLDRAHFKGNKNAPVTVVEFSDLQCPYCQSAHESVKNNLFKDFSENEVRLAFKHFPLGNHPWAEPAAVAVECAGEQGGDKFWAMIDHYFEDSKNVTPENVKQKGQKFANELKLDVAKFNACVEKGDVKQFIEKDRNEGQLVGVRGTPSFIVNGRLVRGSRYDDLKAVIQDKLNKK